VKTERIHYASEAPTVFLANGKNLWGASFQRAREGSMRIGDNQNHSHGAAADKLWTGVEVFWGFVTHPKHGSIDGEFCDYGASRIFQAMALDRSECGFVEFDSSCTVSN
jgi:hypothetical protein